MIGAMFVAAVLCPDEAAFVGWCRAHDYVPAGDGAEAASGRWMAVRVLGPDDLRGLTVDRVDYAVGYWRGELAATVALDELARACIRRRGAVDGDGDGDGAGAHHPRGGRLEG